MAQVAINSGTIIGEGVIVNTGAMIDHDIALAILRISRRGCTWRAMSRSVRSPKSASARARSPACASESALLLELALR